MSKQLVIAIWIARIIAAVILLQTLFFKFTGAEESKYIFSELGVEPWGRIITGILELITTILLLVPATIGIGAIFGLILMVGAILSHITIFGIEVQGDSGQLFIYAVIEFICCAFLTWKFREQIPLFRK